MFDVKMFLATAAGVLMSVAVCIGIAAGSGVLKWMGNCNNGLVNRPHFQDEGTYGMHVTHWMHLPEMPNRKRVNTNAES